MLHALLAAALAVTAPPATAPAMLLAQATAPGQPNPAAMIASLTKMSEDFQSTIRDVQGAVQASATSQERGAEALDRMLAAARAVAASVSDQSEIWRQVDTMLSAWTRQHREAEDRAARDAQFRQIANAWAERVRQASEVRGQIVSERGRTQVMIDQIESERSLILAFYALGEADKALEGLRRINNELGQLNNGLGALVTSARRLAPGAAN